MRYAVATRGSKLSLAQTGHVIQELQAVSHSDTFEILRVTTQGDRDRRPLFSMERRGIFEREVDAAVTSGRADFAVHSMKDVPTDIPDELGIACVPRRLPPNDVLIRRNGASLPARGDVIGTSSVRRMAQIRLEFPDVTIRPIRGNVDTRVSRVGGDFDFVVLAQAGLRRLGLDVSYDVLDTEKFVPSPGQGALAIVARADNTDILPLLRSIQDESSRKCAEAERVVSDIIGSGCRFPVGVYAYPDNEIVCITAAAYLPDGAAPMVARAAGTDPVSVGREAGNLLLDMGAGELGLKWRHTMSEWGS